MEDTNELLDSQNQPNEDSDSLFAIQDDQPDEEKVKLAEQNKRLFARAKKAEVELKALKETPKPEIKEKPVDFSEIEKKVDEKLNERELSAMDLSDNLKSELKAYANAKGVSYKEASKSEYIKFLSDKEASIKKEEEASANSQGGTKKAERDFGKLSGEEISKLSNDEWEAYKGWRRDQ